MKRKNLFKPNFWVSMFVVLFICSTFSNAQPPSHDPSSMIQNTDGRYWIFTTGQGIWCMSSSSTSFSSWRAETTPFGNSYPSWIKNYVTGFTGFFWGPDVVKSGSYYFLYYSCAGVGAPAAIGVTRASTLTGPWTDQGRVLSGNNAIDPGIIIDGSKMWMAWGNWQSGIDICELNPTSGKRKNSTSTHLVSGQVEGPAVIKNGSYYYLFYQRGLCCNGVNSTYYVVVARSTSVTGPYTGERTFLPNKSGRIIGPGHIGYGCGKLTYHFYDGNDNGAAKLAITTLSFSNGWPVAGSYKSSDGEDLTELFKLDDPAIFPNPSNGNFTVNLNNLNTEKNVSITVFDLSGRIVYNQLLYEPTEQVEINANLVSGSYIVQIEHEKGITTQKLVVN